MFLLEQEHLRPVLPTKLSVCEESMTRSVRKDNTVLYLSNRYSVPQGTFGKGEEVVLRIDSEKLVIEQVFGDYVIAEHSISRRKASSLNSLPIGRIMNKVLVDIWRICVKFSVKNTVISSKL